MLIVARGYRSNAGPMNIKVQDWYAVQNTDGTCRVFDTLTEVLRGETRTAEELAKVWEASYSHLRKHANHSGGGHLLEGWQVKNIALAWFRDQLFTEEELKEILGADYKYLPIKFPRRETKHSKW